MKDNRNRRGRGRRPRLWAGVSWALALPLALASPAFAQLPRASAAELGLGDHTVASVRGFGAIASNPAGLGMPRASRVTWSALPFRVEASMGPVKLTDFGEWDGKNIPHAVREEWLQRVEREGRQKGAAGAGVTWGALALGNFGVQIASVLSLATELNPDASELALFGNAGRTGASRDFRFAGSTLDAWAVTTIALAGAFPLATEIGDAPGQSFAVGATLEYTVGHALYLGRDLGSFLAGEDDPLELWVRFPLLQSSGSGVRPKGGQGFSLDLGFQWETPSWGAGLTVRNLASVFLWDTSELVFRPVTALFTQDVAESDVAPRAATEAPAPLLDAAESFGFGTRLAAGVTNRRSERMTWVAQVEGALGESSLLDPSFEVGGGIEYRARPWIPLRAHLSVLEDGVRFGGGAGLQLGDAHLSGAYSRVWGPDQGRDVAMLSLSFGGS